MKLYFATTNEGKLAEAKEILKVKVDGLSLEVDEIQSLDPIDVAVKKARSYYNHVNKPVFVEDVSLSIAELQGLPGPYIDAFMKTLGNEGILRILINANDRSATAQATVVYISDKEEKIFVGIVEGKISESAKGGGFGWDPIFIPKGEIKTFGEMTLAQKNKYSMRAKALRNFSRWLKNAKISTSQ